MSLHQPAKTTGFKQMSKIAHVLVTLEILWKDSCKVGFYVTSTLISNTNPDLCDDKLIFLPNVCHQIPRLMREAVTL